MRSGLPSCRWLGRPFDLNIFLFGPHSLPYLPYLISDIFSWLNSKALVPQERYIYIYSKGSRDKIYSSMGTSPLCRHKLGPSLPNLEACSWARSSAESRMNTPQVHVKIRRVFIHLESLPTQLLLDVPHVVFSPEIHRDAEKSMRFTCSTSP